ncbi:MAG: DUF4381 domain-containing protein [Gammaproteobacteria bacterium]|nr:DUF4381 domain-containing protein [Gammaproteobacteria bacterium]
MQDSSNILRDIHDLDAIPWWPLATGWWYVIGLVVLVLLVAGIRYRIRYSGIMPGWRGDARRQLRALKKALRHDDPRDVAGRLSILLRRIAMARSGRREAAGLTGDSWLNWLEQNDSTGFKWTKRGRTLLQAPYMPPTMTAKRNEVMRLVTAAARWVDTTPVTAERPGLHWLKKINIPRIRKTKGAAGV